MASKSPRYHELQKAAVSLDPKAIHAYLRQLAGDPRFAGVVAWLDRYEGEWSRTVAQQNLAAQHGQLAHAAGSLHALHVLQTSLRGLIDGPAEPQSPAL